MNAPTPNPVPDENRTRPVLRRRVATVLTGLAVAAGLLTPALVSGGAAQATGSSTHAAAHTHSSVLADGKKNPFDNGPWG